MQVNYVLDALVPEGIIQLLMAIGKVEYEEVITTFYCNCNIDSALMLIQADRISRLHCIVEGELLFNIEIDDIILLFYLHSGKKCLWYVCKKFIHDIPFL